ncbi:hypothetical protein [Streptomyces sp. ME19-01-6]|uniref:hypothetical protein n=1 Tax=Streptomyces sp. ME19-01-6 TaxID=3028686 RepID=UPI0029BE5F74|nr:hypothetical protein [Streptomyces sp. ME19-01-6]MDX3233633.1 hypothetical protein [Streptomyces sp. ME19-01-6]
MADALRDQRLTRAAGDRHRDDRDEPRGTPRHVIHNWSWEPADVAAPVELSDVLDGSCIPAGTALELGAWNVRTFVTANAPTA